MATGRLFIPGWMPARDSDGDPIPNVSVSFYNDGTDVLATVYANEGLTIPLINPVQANSSGRFPQIYADDANLFSASVDAPYGPPGQPFTFDGLSPSQAADIAAANLAQGAADDAEAALSEVQQAIEAATQAGGGEAAVAGAIAGQSAANAVVAGKANTAADNISGSIWRDALGVTSSAVQAGDTGATLIGYKAPGSPILTSVASALGDFVDARRFGAVGDDVSRPLSSVSSLGGVNTTGWSVGQWQTLFPHVTSTTDELDWAAVQSALNYRKANLGGPVVIPRRCVMNRTLSIDTSFVGLIGDGADAIIRSTGGSYNSLSVIGPNGGQIIRNIFQDIFFEEDAKSGGLAGYVSNVALTEMRGGCGASDHRGFEFRNFNNVKAALISQRLKAAGQNVLIRSAANGASASSDVIELNLSISGQAPNNTAPTVLDRSGVVIDGFVNTVRLTGYLIGVDGVGVRGCNTVGAIQGPGYVRLDDLDVEYSARECVKIESGFIWSVNNGYMAGAYNEAGIRIFNGVRGVTVDRAEIYQCGKEGIVNDGYGVGISNSRIYENSCPTKGRGGTAGATAGIYLGANSRQSVVNSNRLGDSASASNQSYGVIIDSAADELVVSNNVGNRNVGGCVLNPSGTSPTRVVVNNV